MGAKVDLAVIFGSAPCAEWHFLTPYLLGEHPLIICADGGIHHAVAAGLTPDLVIGDWDSGGTPLAGTRCITLPVEKDMTDLQAAAEQALALGARRLLLCGCTGGRLDHTASNLVLLEWIFARGGEGMIVDGANEVRLLTNGAVTTENKPHYRYLSVLPLDRQVLGVTLRGVKYPLEEATLTRGDTFSVSNEPVGRWQEIAVASGRILIIRSERTDLMDECP